MTKVVYLDAYRDGRRQEQRSPPELTDEEDTILIRRMDGGTYIAHLSGAYASSPLLVVEHASDLASEVARKMRFP